MKSSIKEIVNNYKVIMEYKRNCKELKSIWNIKVIFNIYKIIMKYKRKCK